jgi:uncharacterized membrane protein YeaQ/YmgE (transglycosylase-associated protein family)
VIRAADDDGGDTCFYIESEIIMGILSWILFGLIAGLIAKAIMPGPDFGGLVVTTLLGIVGAVVGGFLGTSLGFGTADRFDVRSLAVAVVGGVVVLIVYRLLARQSIRL